MPTLKKISVAFGILFLLLLTVALVAPSLIDVDRYRPQIVELASQHLNGKLELGKLKLSLWGKVRVEVAGLRVIDEQGQSVLSVEDASFLLPFSSIFSGNPLVVLEMRQPEISVVQGKDGKLNVVRLLKKRPGASASESDSTQQQSSAETHVPSEVVLPGIVARARLGLKIQRANLSYRDLNQSTQGSLRELDLVWDNASLTQASRLAIGFILDSRVGQLMSVQGPVRLNLDTTPSAQGGVLSGVTGVLDFDASDLEVQSSVGFKKSKGVPVQVLAKFSVSQQDLRLDDLRARFHTAALTASGVVKLSGVPEPQVDLKIQSEKIELKPFEELVALLQPYRLGGAVRLNAQVSGAASAIRYSGKLGVEKLSFMMPQFKVAPEVNGTVSFSNDRLDQISFDLSAPGSDLSLQGRLAGFLSPQFDLKIESKKMDLDQWFDWTAPQVALKKEEPVTAQTPTSSDSKVAARGVQSDLDQMMDPIRKNSLALAARGSVVMNMASIRAMKVFLEDIDVKLLCLPGLTFQLDRMGLKAYQGVVSAQAKVDLKPAAPTYSFSGSLKALDLQQAVESQLSMFRNTLLGELSAAIQGSGSSFDPKRATQRLSMKGDFSVQNGSFATIDIGKMAVEGINQAMDRAAEKVPALKGRKLGAHRGTQSKYQVIRSKFSLSGGKFVAPDFVAVAEKNKGIDIKGSLSMDLVQQDLSAQFELTDTYNLTGARDVSVDMAGQKVEAVLAEKGKPVRFPVSVGCKMVQPCPSYTELPEHFARVVGTNLAGGVAAKAKSEVQKKLGEAIKNVPLPGAFKKLFR